MKKIPIVVIVLIAGLVVISVFLFHTKSVGEADLSKAVLKPGVYPTKWIIPDEDVYATISNSCYAGYIDKLPSSVNLTKFISKSPVFGYSTSPDLKNPKKILKHYFAIDESKGTSKGYDLLYFDANQNGLLSDDKPVTKNNSDHIYGNSPDFQLCSFKSVADIPLDKLIPKINNSNPVRLDFDFEILKKMRKICVTCRTRGCYAGMVDTSQGGLSFQLIDFNFNGKYNDTYIGKPYGVSPYDMIIFGYNRQQKYGEKRKFYSGQVVSSVNLFNDRLYIMKPDVSGKNLSIADYTGPSEKFRIDIGKIGMVSGKFGYRIPVLSNQSGLFGLPKDGHSISLPVGKYHVSSFIIEPPGKQLRGWGISYMPRDSAVITPDHESVINVSGNIKFIIEPYKKQYTLQRGIANKTLLILQMPEGVVLSVDNPGLSEVPVFKLKDASGKVAYKGDTNLDGYYKDFKVLPKSVKPGRYTAEASFDVGPFGGKLVAKREVFVK